MAIYSPLPVQPGENLRTALIAVPVPPGANYGRSISTIRGGLPQNYPVERGMSPLPMRWASPVRERGAAVPSVAAVPGVTAVPGVAAPGVAVRSFSPTRQILRHASPLHVPTRGIVFPGAIGAMPAMRPPLLPDPKAQAVPVDDWQKRRQFTRTVSPARSPLRRVPANQGTPFMRVGSPKPTQRWVFSHQPMTVAVHLTHKRPSTGSAGSGSHPPEMKMERRNSEGKELPNGRCFRRICVYGGSSSKVRAEYLQLAVLLGQSLARQKIGLVFGGGKVGMMGAVADAVLAMKGEVIGVIPRSMVDLEIAHEGCTSLRVVETMHERMRGMTSTVDKKALMAELSDAFIALPGGWGTLEELAEADVAESEADVKSADADVKTDEFRWQPPQLPSEPASLKEGQVVTVGKLQLRVGLAIGEGAYARVFGAIGVETQEDVAIKEMRCGHGAGILPDASLQRAIYEVKVMRLLTEASEGEELRVPKLLDHQFWDLPAEPGAFLCRVAMTRRRGQALISWLEERAACADVPDGTCSSYCLCFLRAAHSARELLSQLAPTFAKLNGIAMHRDVNARNILVFCPNSALEGGAAPKDTSSLEFTLLDFGSSLDFKAWSSSSGEGSWAVENPTGDARYWGPASWVRFLHGPHVMEGGLRQQYSLGLDAFALAICTLEVIAKLHGNWRLPKEAAMSDEVEVELMESIDQFHRAWSRYWTFAVSCFERLAEYSQMVCFGEQQKATQLWEDARPSWEGSHTEPPARRHSHRQEAELPNIHLWVPRLLSFQAHFLNSFPVDHTRATRCAFWLQIWGAESQGGRLEAQKEQNREELAWWT
eukprot:s379_g36.t2